MSGSNNINVSVTADATQLRAKLAIAQDAVKTYGKEVRNAAADLRTASDSMRAGLLVTLGQATDNFKTATDAANKLKAEIKGVDTKPVEAIKPAAEGAKHGLAGIVQELIVVGHEAMQGRFSRIPGSLVVMGERSGALTQAIAKLGTSFTSMGALAVAAGAAAVGALAYIIVKANEASNAVREVRAQAYAASQSPDEATVKVKEWAGALHETGVVGTGAAYKIGVAIEGLTGISQKQRDRIAGMGAGLFLRWGKDTEEFQKGIEHLASTTAFKDFADKEGVVTGALQAQYDELTTDTEKYNLLLDATEKKYIAAGNAAKKAQQDAHSNLLSAMGGGGESGTVPEMKGDGNVRSPRDLGDIGEPATKAPTPEERNSTKIVAEGNEDLVKRNQLIGKIASAQASAAAAAAIHDTVAEAAAKHAQANFELELHNNRLMGEASWAQKEEDTLNKSLVQLAIHATSAKQLAEDENRTKMEFWAKAAAEEGISQEQRDAATARSTQARLAMTKEELKGEAAAGHKAVTDQLAILNEKQAAARDDFKLVMRIEDEKLALLKGAGDQYIARLAEEGKKKIELIRAHDKEVAALGRAAARAGAAAERKSVGDEIATLNEKQDAAREDFKVVMQIEEQKIALLARAGNAFIARLAEENKKKIDLIREHEKEVMKAGEESLVRRIQVDNQAISQESERLADEVLLDRMSRATMLATLREFIATKRAIEIRDGEAFAASLKGSEKDYAAFLDKLKVQKARYATEDAKLNLEITHDLTSKLEGAMQPVTASFDSAIDSMITGQTKLGDAVLKMSGSIITAYGKMALEAGQKWAVGQIAMLFKTRATETAITASTAAGSTQRIAMTHAEGSATNSTLLERLGNWLATELGLTAANTTGAVTRTAEDTAMAGASMTAAATAARAAIGGQAAIASAAAFADSASLGPYGLVAAPAAGAAAYGAVMLNQGLVPGLAVGAWDVPRDMGANLHAGEMVVPANFASGMRGALAGAGGSSATNLNYSPVIHGGTGSDMPSMMRQQAAAMKAYAWHATRNGAVGLPGR